MLLFKKFTMDFASKYNVPKLQIDESAKRAIMAYSWPGNIRQLKNIAEQISILELNREIDGETISHYLPKEQKSNLPTIAGHKSEGKTFESEREILYSVLFDMRRDITELKKQIADAGVHNYSIYWDRDTNILFGYQEIEGEISSQDMGADAITQRWWDYMADIMEVNPDNSPVTIPIREVFHLE